MPWLEPDIEGRIVLPDSFMELWSELALSTVQADPFCCGPAWNLAYQRAINPDRKVFYASSADSALILSECMTTTGEIALTPLEDSWLYGQPLLGDNAPELLDDCLPELLAPYHSSSPLILISGIIKSSVLAAHLFLRHSKYYDFYRHAKMAQCSASLRNGVDGWLSRRSANCRAKLKKARKMAQAAGIEFERHRPAPADTAAIYARMLSVEAKSWKGIGHCGMTEQPSADFYAEMIDILAASTDALVIFARHEGEDIGFIFGGLAGDFYRGQQFSYSQEYSRYSLGNILQFEQIRWLEELGARRYDMGPANGPRMEYKHHWTEQGQEFETWIMRKPS